MTDTKFSREDVRRIQEMSVKRGLNDGKGYAFETVRAVLMKGTRSNEIISKLGEEYQQNLDNFLNQK